MKFFLDTACVEEIEALVDTGMVDGVTTNPTLIVKSGGDMLETVLKIASIVEGPVSAECVSEDYVSMLKEGEVLSELAKNIAVKVPLTEDGLRVCRTLSSRGVMVNVTLCFSAVQALLAAKAGASFVSPFVGRLDDVGGDGMGLVEQILEVYDNYDMSTEVLVASVRHSHHVLEAARMGADVVTLPPSVLRKLYGHPLTAKGLDDFLRDWRRSGQGAIEKRGE